MSIHKWQEMSRKVVHDDGLRKLEQVDSRMPDGSIHTFVIDVRRAAASIVGITRDGKVILVRQFRIGPNKILDELPGGFVDPGENPQETAHREFIEETGYDGEFEIAGSCIDDAYSTMMRHCYVAKNCKKIGEPQVTPTEQTKVVLLSLSAFSNHLRKGALTDTEMGYMGLDYLKLL